MKFDSYRPLTTYALRASAAGYWNREGCQVAPAGRQVPRYQLLIYIHFSFVVGARRVCPALQRFGLFTLWLSVFVVAAIFAKKPATCWLIIFAIFALICDCILLFLPACILQWIPQLRIVRLGGVLHQGVGGNCHWVSTMLMFHALIAGLFAVRMVFAMSVRTGPLNKEI